MKKYEVTFHLFICLCGVFMVSEVFSRTFLKLCNWNKKNKMPFFALFSLEWINNWIIQEIKCVLGCLGVTWGVLGDLGESDRPTQLSTSYSFHKNLLYFLSNQHLQCSRPDKQITALYFFLCMRCVLVFTRIETLKFNI